jgi:alkanesulfonate monooxygenase SsuD/methylene tetrahydromethanopterin reductase-like flavin-dependent oxidoreductase (luciferase family)
MRAPLINQEIYPKTERGSIPLRVGVGGTPESVVRAARLNAKLAIAIIGGDPARFAPFADLYRSSMNEFAHPIRPISIHSPGHIAASQEIAIEELWPHYQVMFGRIGRERGWGQVTKEHFINEVKYGSFYVGTPEQVARKIAYAMKSIGAERFDFKYSNGPMAHSKLMNSIELYATKVVPMVKEILSADREASIATSR